MSAITSLVEALRSFWFLHIDFLAGFFWFMLYTYCTIGVTLLVCWRWMKVEAAGQVSEDLKQIVVEERLKGIELRRQNKELMALVEKLTVVHGRMVSAADEIKQAVSPGGP